MDSAAAVVALSCDGHLPGEALRICLSALVGCPSPLEHGCAAIVDAAHAFRQCGAVGLGSDLMCSDWLVVVGDDGARETTGVESGAAVHDMRAVQRAKAIFLFGGPLVDVGGVGFAAARDDHVEHRSGGVLAEHGVGGVGGDASSTPAGQFLPA